MQQTLNTTSNEPTTFDENERLIVVHLPSVPQQQQMRLFKAIRESSSNSTFLKFRFGNLSEDAIFANIMLSHKQTAYLLDERSKRYLLKQTLEYARRINSSSKLSPPKDWKEANLPTLPEAIQEKVRDDQLAALWYIENIADGRAILGDDPGSGKTLMAHATTALRGGKTIIVCKSTLKGVMEDEIHKWVSPDARILMLDGQKPAPNGLDDADYYVVNYEILHHRVEELENCGASNLLCDESQMLKSEGVGNDAAREWMSMSKEERKEAKKKKPQGAWRTWAAEQIATSPDMNTVLLMSATPSPNGRHIEWMPQLKILGRLDDFGGAQHFEERYTRRCIQCIEGGDSECLHHPKAKFQMKTSRYPVPNTFGSINASELSDRLRATVMVRRSQLQIMPFLDPVTPIITKLPLSKEGAKEYRQVEEEFKSWLKVYATKKANEEGTSVKAAIARALRSASSNHEVLVKRAHLRQVAARAKLPAFLDYVSDLVTEDADTHVPRKAVIFAWHRDVQKELIESLSPFVAEYRVRHIEDRNRKKRMKEAYLREGVPTILAATDMSREEIRENTKRFQEDPEEPIIVCSLAAAAEGHTLDSGWHVLHFEPPPSAASARQAVGRCFGRSSNPHTAFSHEILGIGTIDMKLSEALDLKKAMMAATLDEGRTLEWAEPKEHELAAEDVEALVYANLLGE